MTMREILFRGKRINTGEWLEGCAVKKIDPLLGISYWYIVRNELSDGGMLESVASWYKVDPATVGQYTGLKDRNGKRIFEGDIVRYYSTYREEFTGENCVVEYGVYNCSCCDGVYGWEFKGGDIRIDECYEIIGNIHDNPELLGRCDNGSQAD